MRDDLIICSLTGVISCTAAIPRRTAVPRAARPHVAWVSEASSGVAGLGQPTVLTPSENPPPPLVLTRLLTVDAPTGLCLQQYGLPAADQSFTSSPIPSGRPVMSVIAADDVAAYVSDDVGNVFSFRNANPIDEQPKARRRTEGGCGSWSSLTPAASTMPSLIPTDQKKSIGMPGWSALSPLGSSSAALLSVREFFQDTRVIDTATGSVLRCYSTTHPATGVYAPGVDSGSLASCFLITEGRLCTMYDSRCPSAVLTWDEAEDMDQWRDVHDRCGDAGSCVKGRLTSIGGIVRDVCGAANPTEVALCMDRAVCVYDVRKFARQLTSSNVLKYNIASVASLRRGTAVACAGLDSEVRLVSLEVKKKAPKSTEFPAQPATEEERNENLAGTFRTRLNSSICCEQTWQGGWVTSQGEGAAAVGVSTTGEVFLAY